MAHPGRDLAPGVYLELARKRVFAVTLSWPGCCRSGRDEATTLEALQAPRTYVRRAAWHALDHAWEIEDRAA